MKKLIYLLMSVLLVITMSFSLVACNKDEEEEEEYEPEEWELEAIFDLIGNAMPESNLCSLISMNVSVPNTSTGNIDEYSVVLASDTTYKEIASVNEDGESEVDKDVANIDLAFKVVKGNIVIESQDTKDEALDKVADAETVFAMYISEGKLFLSIGGVNVCVEDIDVNYLIDVLNILPADQNIIDAILGSLLQMNMMDVLNTVALLVPTEIYCLDYGDSGEFELKFDIGVFLGETVPSLLGGLIPDNIFGPGIKLPDTGITVMSLLQQVLELIPQGKVVVTGNYEDGAMESIDVAYVDYEDAPFINTSTRVFRSEETSADKLIPEDIRDYKSFSFTNFAFDVNLGADINHLDVGAFVNMLTGKTPEKGGFPMGTLLINVEDYNLKLRVNGDLDGGANSRNMLAFELFDMKSSVITGDKDETDYSKMTPLLGIYYIDELIKVNISELVQMPGINIPNIQLSGIDLGEIFDLIGDKLDGMVRDFITGLLPEEGEEGEGGEEGGDIDEMSSRIGGVSQTGFSNVIPVSVSSDGSTTFAKKVSDILVNALKMFGFDDDAMCNGFKDKDGNFTGNNIGHKDKELCKQNHLISKENDADGNNFVKVNIGRAFFRQLDEMLFVDEDGDGERDSYKFKDDMPFILDLRATLGVYTNANGLDKIKVTAGYADQLDIAFEANNFSLGYSDKFNTGLNDKGENITLKDYINSRVGGAKFETVGDLKALVLGSLDGISAKANAVLELKAGKYDIAGLLAMFGVTIPDIDINLSRDYKLNLEFIIKVMYNHEDSKASKAAIEFNVSDDQELADLGELKEYIVPGSKLFGLYIDNGSVYVDLSGIKVANLQLPKLKADVDIMALLYSELEKLVEYDFDLSDIMDGLLKPDSPDNTSPVRYSAVADTTANDSISIDLSKKMLQIKASSAAIISLLKVFGVKDLKLPDFEFSAEANGVDTLKAHLQLNDKNGDLKLGLDFNFSDFNIGEALTDEDFEAPEIDFDPNAAREEYEDDMVNVVKQLLYHVDLSLNIGVDTQNTNVTMDMARFLNNLLAIAGQRIDMPLNVELDRIKDSFTLNIKWNINENNKMATEILIELYSEDFKDYIDNPTKERRGFFVGIYYKDGTFYADLSQFGLVKLMAQNLDLTSVLVDQINSIVTSLTDSMGISLNLTDILNNLLGSVVPTTSNVRTTNNLLANASATATSNNMVNSVEDRAGAEFKGLDTKSLLEVILGNLLISDDKGIIIDLLAEAIIGASESDLNKILLDLGINIEEQVGVEVIVKLLAGTLAAELEVNNLKLGIGLNILNVGSDAKPVDWATRSHLLTKDEYTDLTENKDVYSIGNIILNLFENVAKNKEGATIGQGNNRGSYPILSIDLQNQNNYNYRLNSGLGEPADTERTYMVMYKATKDFDQTDRDAHKIKDYPVKKGNYIINIYTVNRDATSKTCVLVVVIDLANNHIQIQGTYDLFQLSLIGINLPLDGTVINIGLDLASMGLDLKSMLNSGILGEQLPVFGSAKSATADVNANAEGDEAEEENQEVVRNITCKISSDNTIKLSLKLNLKSVSDALNKMLKDLFSGLAKGYFPSEPWKWIVDYNLDTVFTGGLDSGAGFFNDLWWYVVIPLINEQLDNMGLGFIDVGTFNGSIGPTKVQVFKTLGRILPIARFDEMDIDLNIVNGGVHSIFLNSGYVPFYENDNTGNVAGNHHIEALITNKALVNDVDWGGLPEKYEKYEDPETKETVENGVMIFDQYSDRDLIEKLKSIKAFKMNLDNPYVVPDEWYNKDYTNVKYYNNDHKTPFDLENLKLSNGQYIAGDYNISASYLAADNQTYWRDFLIRILPAYDVISVDPVVVPAFRDLPPFVFANVDGDPNTAGIQEKKILISNIKLVKDGKDYIVKLKNGAGSTLVDKAGVPIKVSVKEDTTGKDDYTYNSVIEMDAFNQNNYMSVMPKGVFVYNNAGKYWSSIRVLEWEMSSFTGVDWINGGKYPNIIAKTALGDFEYTIDVLSSKINNVMFDKANPNVLTLDPLDLLDYYAYTEAINKITDDIQKDPSILRNQKQAAINRAIAAMDEQLRLDKKFGKVVNPFPSTVDIAYVNSENEERTVSRDIVWDLESVLNSAVYDIKGKDIDVIIRSPEGSEYEWTHTVTVRLESREAKNVVFDKDEQGDYITTQTINPFKSTVDDLNELLPEKDVKILYANKKIDIADLDWYDDDVERLKAFITPDGGNFVMKAKVLPQFRDWASLGYLSEDMENVLANIIEVVYKQNVRAVMHITQMNIKDVYAEDKVKDINHIADYFYNGTDLSEFLPEELRFEMIDGTIATLPISGYTDMNGEDVNNIQLDINGDTAQVMAKVTCGSNDYPFPITIKTPNRLNPNLNGDNSIVISYYDYVVKGVDAFGSQIELNFGEDKDITSVKWDLGNVNFNTGNGVAVLTIGKAGSNLPFVEIAVKVTITGAPNLKDLDDKPFSLANGYESVYIEKDMFDAYNNGRLQTMFDRNFNTWSFNYFDGNSIVEKSTINIEWVVGDLQGPTDENGNFVDSNDTVRLVVYTEINNAKVYLAGFDVAVEYVL